MNQFKIQNDALYETLRERGLANAALTKFKIKDSHATCGWGFNNPWETMILSRANATANAPLAGVSA